MTRRAATLIVLVVAWLGAGARQTLTDSVKAVVDTSPRHVEGIYEMSGGGAVFAVLPSPGHTGRWDLLLIDSPDLAAEPGTVFGHAVAGASPEVFDARLRRDLRPDRRSGSHDFAMRLTQDGRLSFEPYRNSRRISLWRWIPYLFRITVVEQSNRPKGLDGAVRVYPPGAGATPRSL